MSSDSDEFYDLEESPSQDLGVNAGNTTAALKNEYEFIF